jgi:hypothetical protein
VIVYLSSERNIFAFVTIWSDLMCWSLSPCNGLSPSPSTISDSDFRQTIGPSSFCGLVRPYRLRLPLSDLPCSQGKDIGFPLEGLLCYIYEKDPHCAGESKQRERGSAIRSGKACLGVSSLRRPLTHENGQPDAFPFGAFGQTTGAGCRD